MALRRIYMVGIGGIGMSALAQLYLVQGATVTGSDREDSPVTALLREKGIDVCIGQSASQVPQDAELVVYSDAVPATNPERARAAELRIPQMNYFEALGKAAEGKRVIAVAGTHGKTTTTAMLAKILVDAGLDPTVVVGSIVSEWGSNFRAGSGDLFVVEACEYRGHLLVFSPELLLITNLEWDHTDYFKNFGELEALFADAKRQASAVIERAQYAKEEVPELLLPGEFNQDNARAAKAAARAIAPALSEALIDTSLAAYKGTWRRFEYKGRTRGGADLYDDYAHHPTAIAKTIAAARQKFPDRPIVVVFHPHLYSRTRDLFGDFAQALSTADLAYILPVYAAREEPDLSVSNIELAKAVRQRGGNAEPLRNLDEAAEKIYALAAPTIAFTMGAGDVYKAGESALAT